MAYEMPNSEAERNAINFPIFKQRQILTASTADACSHCRKPPESADDKLLSCGQCKQAQYCSKVNCFHPFVVTTTTATMTTAAATTQAPATAAANTAAAATTASTRRRQLPPRH
jgi:hypothetical protein